MADSPNDLPGLLSHLRKPGGGVPVEELRLATVLNGGVSLAVWMGGATLEIDRLVKADPDDDTSPYAAMLKLTGCTARTDVISGTSAGGINGAALALAQANPSADLATMRDVWSDQGDVEKLGPFRALPHPCYEATTTFCRSWAPPSTGSPPPLAPAPTHPWI